MTAVQTSQKVGRNDLCPCGSGQKHKKCCGSPLRAQQGGGDQSAAVAPLRLTERHLADLQSSGLSEATIRAAGLYSIDDREAQRLGFGQAGPGLLFPYLSRNGEAPFYRLKPDVPRAGKDGRPAKYLTVKGAGNRLYLPPTLPARALTDITVPLLLTEGEKKTLKAIQEKFCCVGLAGVWCWRSREGEQSAPLADFERLTWKGRPVYICFDSDLTRKPEVQRAEWALAQELQRRGAVVKVVRLPGGENGEKVGLDDFLIAQGAEALRQLLSQAQEPAAWPEPQLLPDALPPVEPFPTELLPQALRGWVQDVAQRMQCPADYPAVGAMVALSAVVGRQLAIRPRQRDDWTVVPNLWGAVVGRPGLLKSPALAEVRRPLDILEARARESYETAMSNQQAQEMVAEARRKKAQQDISQALKEGKDPQEIAREAVQAEPPPPVRRRYLVHDVTVEKLGEILKGNPRGVLLFRDELTGFLKTLERDGHEADRAFFLESWNGTGRFSYDRIGRGTVDIEAACISILGGIQPGPLSVYLARAARGGGDDDGLVQRFQLVAWPDLPGEWQDVDTLPDAQARQRAFEVFERLDRIDPAAVGAETPAEGGLPFLRFTPAAQEVFTEWRGELERRLRKGDLPSMLEAHLAKYRSLIPSLALLIHLADIGRGQVGENALLMACAWGEYLESHARRLYAPALSPSTTAARALAKHIKAGDLEEVFTPGLSSRRGGAAWRSGR